MTLDSVEFRVDLKTWLNWENGFFCGDFKVDSELFSLF